ncbi:MAG: hypothetical protein Q4E61_02210, partial [Alphaproteobacteria bacterium]|nr:hypothetical protein [Alphaproteobacteria bacterium]
MKKKIRKFEVFVAFLAIVLLAITVTVLIMYSMNPEKLQNSITVMRNFSQTVQEKMLNSIGKEDNKIPQDNIEFPDEEKLTDPQKYYYYQQLSETGKKIYLTIEKNIESLKNGEDNIPLPPSLNDDAKANEKGKEYIAQEFQSAWDAFITDRSEYFYIYSGKVCLVTKMTTKGSNTNYEFFIGKGNNDNYLVKEFSTKDDVDNAIKEIENIKNDIISNANGNNYEKMKYVHDWIVDNVKYDTTNGDNSTNIYGC